MRIRAASALMVLQLLLISAPAFAADAEDGAPVADQALEKRLAIKTAYTSKPGDTLEAVANLLYGHRSWWVRLRDRNKSLIGYGAKDRLPTGTRLSYLAPKMGTEYVVHRNDWLIRIVQWKYGDTAMWEEIYRKNAAQIANPNLIYPGEKLSLGIDGTIRKSGGEIIVRGLNTPAPVASAAPAFPTENRELASKPQKPEDDTVLGMQRRYLFAGFASGVLFLLLMPVFWWLNRPREQAAPAGEPHLYLETEEEPEEPAEPSLEEPGRKGFPYTFKRGRVDDFGIDKSLISPEDGEVNRKPNYFSISGKRKKFMRKRSKG